MSRMMRFPTAVARDPAVTAWLERHGGELGAIARHWYAAMRGGGDDVRELLHDGQPTVCVDDAAFAYVDVHARHVNVGFFLGAGLSDPAGLLEGRGRFMRHVKLRPGRDLDAEALLRLIAQACDEMRARVRSG
jgi:hypothetical protein